MNFNFKQNYPGDEAVLHELLDPLFGTNTKGRKEDILKSQPDCRKDADQAKILDIHHIGTYALDIDPVEVFDVTLDDSARISHSRVNIQRAIRRMLRKYTASLIFFHYKNNEGDWRLSFLYKDKSLSDTTPAKRYTYLLGPDRDCRTVTERFALLENKTKNVENILSAFSVEVLTKEFYKELSTWYFWALKYVKFPEESKYVDDKNHEYKAKNVIRLLTRLLFIWFIKEKGLIPEELFDYTYLRENVLKKTDEESFITTSATSQKSVYYKAILQNLFFASLNCPLSSTKNDKRKRGFRKKDSDFGVMYLMRYEKLFKDPQSFLELINSKVPFLNGGLFECLDIRGEKEDKSERIYIDGFSDNLPKQMQLVVPDFIFFGQEHEEDISTQVGISSKDYQKAKPKGLFNILKSYNFTIEENTPIEEEVALDPELLGRVFENLLASYNPETQTTARKQTGSFYTPREIVNYMVDESLKAYLKQKLETDSGLKPEETDKKLSLLIGYNEKYFADENRFDEQQTSLLINAINNCKILDPACGSGAFPMGILHKLVHILHKLDPENVIWQETQRQKAIKETEDAFKIGNKLERENLLKDISDVFKLNSDDYGRKLFLIENCIYGVDIQPIATQISKLRFFISLIVDQKTDMQKENFGVRPLPNLETKFVAANTLIGIDEPKEGDYAGNIFDDQSITELEKKIKEIRHRLFSAKTPETKSKLRAEDRQLREQMGAMLTNAGLSNESSHQLAAWDPYDQNASSPFFNSEWMFGIKDGFDVVIGNPPYVNSKKIEKTLRNQYNKIYKEILTMDMDLYQLFFFFSIRNAKSKASISFVTSNSFLTNQSFCLLRSLLLKETRIISILDFPHRFFPFESVNTETAIIILKKQKQTELSQEIGVCIFDRKDIKTTLNIQNQVQIPVFYTDNGFYINLSEISKKIININNQDQLCFDEFFNISNPSSLDRKERYPITKKMVYDKCVFTEDEISQDRYLQDISEECVTGDKILRYSIHGNKLYTNVYWVVNNKLRKLNESTYSMMKESKLIGQRITGQAKWRIVFTFDDNGLISMPSVNIITLKNKDNISLLLILLSILNSRLYNYLYKNIFRENNTNITSDVFRTIPIPKKAVTLNELAELVKLVINKKKKDPNIDTSDQENQIDQLVYNLYDLTPEEIAVIEETVK